MNENEKRKKTFLPRVGVIIKWPLNRHFHDVVTDVLMSQTDVREMVDKNNVNAWPLGKIVTLLVIKMRFSIVFGS